MSGMLHRPGETSQRQAARQPRADGIVPLAAIIHPRGFEVDTLLERVCADLARAELRLGGIVQAQQRDCSAGLLVTDLRTGARFDIWQDLGRGATSCRLDERGLADAVPAVLEAVAAQVDLVVINRFGKAESHGGGMLTALTAAIEAGIPVLTAVREPYLEAWSGFHRGMAADLAPEPGAVTAWCLEAAARSAPRL
jgi:molybdate transport system ATP-binding protein